MQNIWKKIVIFANENRTKRMMEDLKVSILVPVYGVEKFIRQCAESLFSQSYTNLEFVFVDDCTPDNSIAVLQEALRDYPARKNQVRIVRHQTNRGVGAARKIALATATGDFVLSVDGDDYLLPDAVDTLIKIQGETEADIVTGSYFSLFPDGTIKEMCYQTLDKPKTLKLQLAQNTIPPCIWGRLIRRSVYTDNRIDTVEGINMAEDYGLTPRLIFAARRIAYTNKAIYIYRQNSPTSTFSQLSRKHVISILKANEVVRQYIQAHDHRQEYAFALETGMLNAWHTALKGGLTRSEISDICHYMPRGVLFRLCHLLFAHRSTLPLLRFSYLTIKWCYKRRLHYSDKH